MLTKIFAILFLFFIANCSDDDIYDKEKAVSAFVAINALSIDKSLENVEIKIPPQIKNENWGLNSDEKNLAIENFYFAPIQAKSARKQKFLTQDSQIWSAYHFGFSDRFVFEPIIKDDKVFLLDNSGILSAYDLESKKRIFKKRIFKKRYVKNYQNPRISYDDNKILAIAGSNEIVAASAVDGKVIWSKTILSLPISKPVSDGKLVYTTTVDNKTYALNASDGELFWVSSGVDKPTAIFGAAAPVIDKNILLTSYSSGEIYALDKNSGEMLWSQDLNLSKATNSDFYLNDIDATPIVKNDVVFAIGNGGLMMAINIKTGNYLWKKEIAGIADFFASAGFLFIVDKDDKLIALSQKTGAIKWVAQLPDFVNQKKPQSKIIYNGVILAGDKLIISDARGRLLVADPQSGKIEQTFKIGQRIYHAPAIANGKIYLHIMGRFTINFVEVW